MKKREVFLVVGMVMMMVVIGLIGLPVVSADFTKGDNLSEIDDEYYSKEAVRGWINISLEDEPADSVLEVFDNEISLLDFLLSVNANFEVFPVDMGALYVTSSGESSKSFSLSPGSEKTLGILIEGEEIRVTEFSFDVESDAVESCASQLNIDLFDDDVYEWTANVFSEDSFCDVSDSLSCFDDSSTEEGPISTVPYCQRINFPLKSKFRIGAGVTRVEDYGGAVEFKLEVYEDDIVLGSCLVSSEVGVDFQEISCIVDLDLDEGKDVYVCISTSDSSYNNKYSIAYEEDSPCGFSGSPDNFNEVFEFDFDIFAEYPKYISPGSFSFDEIEVKKKDESIELTNYLNDYLVEKYGGNCSMDCVIPINFYSLGSQQVDISNVILRYTKKGIGSSVLDANIYEVQEEPAKINMGFQKIDLEGADLLVPFDDGEKSLVLKLGGDSILSKKINVKAETIMIGRILPSRAPAAFSTKFIAILDRNINDSLFSWDFGDGSTSQTIEPTVSHIYNEVGTYQLSLTVDNYLGNFTKSISVEVVPPYDAINQTIKEYKQDLKNIKAELNKIPDWIKKEIEKIRDIESIEGDLKKQEDRFKDTFPTESDDLIDIMNKLIDLDMPYELQIGEKVNSSKFIFGLEELNLDALEFLGAGNYENTAEEYFDAINSWMGENLDVSFESKTYYLNSRNSGKELLFSDVTINLNSKEEIEEFYLVVNGNPDEIIFEQSLDTKDIENNAEGIIFIDFSGNKKIEFLYPEKVSITNIPVFISPEFDNLEVSVVSGVCNNNGRCDSGETAKNCKNDCKSWGWILFLLFGLFIVGAGLYVLMQEWYKRRYESHLFKNKNNLFNLINFLSISESQSLSKIEIFKKLEGQGWNKEQLNYAWNKYKGRRTGMWEIPLFKWVENRRVKKELEKRGGVNVFKSGSGSGLGRGGGLGSFGKSVGGGLGK